MCTEEGWKKQPSRLVRRTQRGPLPGGLAGILASGSLEGVRRTGKKNKGKKRSERRAARHGRGRPATFEPEGNRTDQTAGRRFVSPFFLLASRRPSYRSVQIRAASFNGSDPTTATLSSQIINLVKLWLTFL